MGAMKVNEFFESADIFQEDILSYGELNSYCGSAATFVLDNWNEVLDDLSPKQIAWAEKICDDAQDKKQRGKL